MVGDRELQFFPGTAHGAVVPGFSYMSGNLNFSFNFHFDFNFNFYCNISIT